MKDGRKWLVLAALCVALIVALFWQRTQIRKLQQQNAELRVELATWFVGPQAQKDVAPSPDPELLRLRAEVAELRRQKVEVARSNTLPLVAQSTLTNESSDLPFEIREQHATGVLKRLVLAMLMIIVDREEQKTSGKLEIVDASGALTPELRRECQKLLDEGEEMEGVNLDTTWKDVELLITDAADLAKLHPNTIVARSVPMKMPNGKWRRIYAFADGSAHRRVHDTPDEVWQALAQ